MLSSILKKVRRQLVLMLAVALVLVAAYVSAGRQFMPAVSSYVAFLEAQILQRSGVPIQIDSLVGSFEGFNPILHINGISLSVVDSDTSTAADENALFLQKASVVIDIPQSIWQRSWVLEDFVVESLELNFDQLESGAWQLRGISGNNAEMIDLNSLYRSLRRISQLSLRDVNINLRTFDGEELRFKDGLAAISNRGRNHYLHADLTLEGYSEKIALSFEVTGNTLGAMAGQLHLEIPEADYSKFFTRQAVADMSVQKLHGGGSFWFGINKGEIRNFVSELKLAELTLVSEDLEPFSLQDVSGEVELQRQAGTGSWQLALSDMSLSWRQLQWSPFNAYMLWRPETRLELRADSIDVSLIAQFLESSGLLDASAQLQLEQYAPRGMLENFSIKVPLDESSDEHLLVKTNLRNVEIGSLRGSPNMWGIHGYAEIDYDAVKRMASGFAEVESNEFRINIPNLFTSIWDHNYVNGSLGFHLDLNDGMFLKLVSNELVAVTDAVDGRVKFTSTIHRPLEGEPNAELELLVGALRFDAAGKADFLPDGPEVSGALATTMQWLTEAILDGHVVNSGVLYRGSTLPNAEASSKTFQSFYLLENGELSFSDAWPKLSDVRAYVIVDDNNIDIEVHETNSLNVVASSVNGVIRQNADGENWLSIRGSASGATSDGLEYLQNSAVGESLKAAFANWQAEGNFSADIEVEVPLNRPQLQTEVRLDIQLDSNVLHLSDYALDIKSLSGPIIFDTRTGLESTQLSGRLFEQIANIQLSSESSAGELESIFVQATGLVTPDKLIEWPMQSQFVRDILTRMDGQFAYRAKLSIDQSGADAASNRLLIDSTLLGASLSLPSPFTKPVEIAMPLRVDMEFRGDRQLIAGSLGPTLSFQLDLEQGNVRDGLVVVGDAQSNFDMLLDNESQGLAVLGNMAVFQLRQWSDFLGEFNSDESATAGLGSSIRFVDLQIENFQFYEQELNDVNMRIIPQIDQKNWLISLESESIAGQVSLPFDVDDYLSLDLQYLRLPGKASDRIGPPPEITTALLPTEKAEPLDVLADIDPRDLPRMQFSTKEFRIGDRPYGNWSFTLNPNAQGVEIDDLAFDFRGLRLGLDRSVLAANPANNVEPAAADSQLMPGFRWNYDGVSHESALTGVLRADNMATVLTANGYAASLESSSAEFTVDVSWPGSPAFFTAANLSGDITINIQKGRFLQRAGAAGALKLISILNFDAIMRRLRFSDDLLRSGLAYDEITGQIHLEDGQVAIQDRLVISGPSSLYQITGALNLKDETISVEMYLTLPISENIPWLGLLTANIPLAVGAYLFDRIFGSQVNSLTSAVYTLEGPWDNLEPVFKQAFGSPNSSAPPRSAVQ